MKQIKVGSTPQTKTGRQRETGHIRKNSRQQSKADFLVVQSRAGDQPRREVGGGPKNVNSRKRKPVRNLRWGTSNKL